MLEGKRLHGRWQEVGSEITYHLRQLWTSTQWTQRTGAGGQSRRSRTVCVCIQNSHFLGVWHSCVTGTDAGAAGAKSPDKWQLQLLWKPYGQQSRVTLLVKYFLIIKRRSRNPVCGAAGTLLMRICRQRWQLLCDKYSLRDYNQADFRRGTCIMAERVSSWHWKCFVFNQWFNVMEVTFIFSLFIFHLAL